MDSQYIDSLSAEQLKTELTRLSAFVDCQDREIKDLMKVIPNKWIENKQGQ